MNPAIQGSESANAPSYQFAVILVSLMAVSLAAASDSLVISGVPIKRNIRTRSKIISMELLLYVSSRLDVVRSAEIKRTFLASRNPTGTHVEHENKSFCRTVSFRKACTSLATPPK